MTNATVVEEPRTKSSSNVVARFRSIREELKKFKDLKEGLVKIR
jgi:ribosomal protein L19E